MIAQTKPVENGGRHPPIEKLWEEAKHLLQNNGKRRNTYRINYEKRWGAEARKHVVEGVIVDAVVASRASRPRGRSHARLDLGIMLALDDLVECDQRRVVKYVVKYM
jgi:hypothetical protein